MFFKSYMGIFLIYFSLIYVINHFLRLILSLLLESLILENNEKAFAYPTAIKKLILGKARRDLFMYNMFFYLILIMHSTFTRLPALTVN